MSDKSLDGQKAQGKATEAPDTPAAPASQDEALGMNTVGAMLEGRFAEIERKASAAASEESTTTEAIAPTPDEPEQADEAEADEPEAEEEVDAEEQDGEADEQAEESDDADEAEETEAEQSGDPDLKELPPQVQAKINKKIGKLTARAKSAEETLEQIKAENQELKARAENRGLTFDEAMAVTKAGIPPDYLAKEEATVIQEEQFLRDEANWAFANLDGAEIDGKEYSAEQMRRYYLTLKAKHEAIQPKASQLIKEKLTQYQEDLKAARELRARKAKLKDAVVEKKAQAKPGTPPPPPAANRKPPVSASKPGRHVFDAEALSREGVTTQSLEQALTRAFGG